MRKRLFVLPGIVLGIILLTTGSFAPSEANDRYVHPDSLWAQWGDVSLRMEKSGRLQAYFESLHRRRRFQGAVLVAEQGVVLHKGYYGMADMRRQMPITDTTAFQLASVSKMFTAAAVLLLYEEGKIDLDDEVSAHLPGWPYAGMTIRHLLNHRSGLARYMAVASWYWKTPREPMSNADVLRQYIRHKPVHFFTPGKGFNYCNTNYVILACLVEQVSGLSFPAFMEERVFCPLDMRQAMIYSRVEDPEIAQEAIGYKAGGRGPYRAPNDYIDGVYGDKGMYASLRDLWQFEQAIRAGRLLRPGTWEQAFTPPPGTRGNYGFGWRTRQQGDERLIYHFGWWRGFRTCFMREPVRDRCVIVLSNYDIPGRNVNYWEVLREVQGSGSLWSDAREEE
ncbi:MAG: hypothetical protein OHK0039_10050 [Bacteroidia bacterium]